MKSKIRVFFAVIIFCVVLVSGFLSIAEFCKADTLFNDDFNSYLPGSISGQGSWTREVEAGYPYTVENSVVNEGAYAIKGNGGYITKLGPMLLDGTITIYSYTNANGGYYIHLLENGIAKIWIDVNVGVQDKITYVNNISPYFHATDDKITDKWYYIQIQWRSSDHKFKYNVDGGPWTDWLIPREPWTTGINKLGLWDVSNVHGPGGLQYFDTIQENPIVGKNPVLIVPGLLGTEMFEETEKLWPDGMRMIVSASDSFMDPLRFDKDLSPTDNDVSANKILKREVTFDYAEGLLNEFASQNYVENENLFTFPYDWRYGVTGVYADGLPELAGKTNVDLLKMKIEEILQQTGADKVDVAAHSMGGLIVKKYVADNPSSHNIGKAIFVGVPNTGAPKAVKVLLQGDNFGVLGLNDSEMKKIAENMPASYDLLPSQQYYDQKGSFVKTIDETRSDGLTNYIVKDLNYSETKSFLTSDHNLNSQGLANAENLHTQSFDNYDMRTAGVDVYAIDGCKTGTIGKIVERRFTTLLGENVDYSHPKITPGDGTVPLESATNLPINVENKFYFLSSSHGKMLSQSGSRQKIVNLISGSVLPVSLESITQDISKCQLDGKAISVFSPVDIFVTDQNGSRLGLAEDGSIINEIPGADFEIWGEHKFVFVPEDSGQVYTINLTGTGNGTFTLKSEDIQNSQITATEVFSNLPVTTELTGQMDLSGGVTTLSIIETPGAPVETILPSATLNPEQGDDLIPPVSTAVPTGTAGQLSFYRSDVSVNINAIDDNSGVLNIHYNLDNAGFQTFNGAQTTAAATSEGAHALIYFATDRAGNNETERTISFTIDKTPPEAIIEFDPAIKDLKFTASEIATIQDNDNIILITDAAGNTTEIILKEKNRKNKMKADLKEIKYSNSGPVLFKKSQLFYSWYFGKDKKISVLTQRIMISNGYYVNASYNGKYTSFTGRDSSGKIEKRILGLKIIKITTNKGDLAWSY